MATRSTRTIDQVYPETPAPYAAAPAPTKSNPAYQTAEQYLVELYKEQSREIENLRERFLIEMKNLQDKVDYAKECERLAERRAELLHEAASRIAEKILEVSWSDTSKSPCITTTTHCFYSAFNSDKEIFKDFVRVFALGEVVDKLYEEHAPESDEIAEGEVPPDKNE